MKDLQKPDHVSLNTLIGRLRDGRFVIPDFQRDFEWRPWDVRDLLRSIFLDYYIGSLLLWKGKSENFTALSCERIYGSAGSATPEYIVLDGQQRLTAMYYAFLAPDVPLPNRVNRYFFSIRVDRFMAEEYDLAFEYDRSKRRWVQLLSDPEAQYSEHIFPLSVVGEGGWALFEWIKGYEQFWRGVAADTEHNHRQTDAERATLHAENAKKFGEHLRGITEQYQIAYIELDRELEIDKVCDIFTQINSKGIQLDTFDLMNALLKPKGLQLKHMWHEVSPRLEFVDTEKMNVYILQVMSILRQAYCSPKYLYFLLPGHEKAVRDPDGTRRKEVLVSNIADFKRRWAEAVDAIDAAIKLLRHPQEFGAISSSYLPYVSILPAFAAVQCHVRSLPANTQLDAQRKTRHWYWASVFLNRYSGSVESTAARDFLDLKAWIEHDAAEPDLIQEFKTRFRTLDFRREVKRGSSVYNGVFNLLVIQGARDWMSGNVPQFGDLDDHHIIPASKASELGVAGLIHSILNRTPLTADTNRKVIHDRLPNAYLPELIKSNGESTVRAVLESHLISPAALNILLRDPFKAEDYEAFISERQRTLLDAIENLLIKERLDLPPRLRELDQQTENVELSLRSVIVDILAGDTAQLPPHVNQKAFDRIEGAAKRNPSIDPQECAQLAKRLEYCDLRELQDIILSKASWPLFEPHFASASKEILMGKFAQLAELRNTIRHSRAVDEITRKEGEAAILWFSKILS
jgi:hypothetical protein